MKEGDIIQWEGKNGILQGKVVLSNSGQFIVKMDNGHTFSLNDLRFSRSAKLIQV